MATSMPAKARGQLPIANIHAGGGGEKIEVRDWDNNIVWEYTLNDSLNRFHHDIAVRPDTSGNHVFAIAWERKTADEAIQAGRNPALLDDGELWPDRIIELEPDGNGSATIVWEWSVWDHLIQEHTPNSWTSTTTADLPTGCTPTPLTSILSLIKSCFVYPLSTKSGLLTKPQAPSRLPHT